MKQTTITINKETFTLVFNWKALKILAGLMKTKYVDEIFDRFAKVVSGGKISIEGFDLIGNLTLAGIMADEANKVRTSGYQPTADDIVSAIMFDADKLTEIVTAFTAIMPQPKKTPEPVGKKKAVPKKK